MTDNAMLENDVALVTGASRGIGRAIALALAGAGARVVGTSTTPEGAAGVHRAAGVEGTTRARRGAGREQTPPPSMPCSPSWTRPEEMPTILVNNAAITRDTLLLRMKPEDWDRVIATNLTSVFRLSKACLRRMMKERRGRIVNLTSIVGVTGNPGQANYAAAKAGVLGFTKSLAKEVASRGITVNAVAPGLHRHRHDARAQRRADARRCWRRSRWGAWARPRTSPRRCCSSPRRRRAYITGETLHVNGGMYMP